MNSSLTKTKQTKKGGGGGGVEKDFAMSLAGLRHIPIHYYYSNLLKGLSGFCSAEVCTPPASLYSKKQKHVSGTDGDGFSEGSFPLSGNGTLFPEHLFSVVWV